jgi:hypothetical protein
MDSYEIPLIRTRPYSLVFADTQCHIHVGRVALGYRLSANQWAMAEQQDGSDLQDVCSINSFYKNKRYEVLEECKEARLKLDT